MVTIVYHGKYTTKNHNPNRKKNIGEKIQ